ncbi:MAG: translation initiation factor IF-3 [Planctomycetes bacterium]|nr:translation initiation factor IF-3 [Planctomycetota bacterium]MBI3835481.1 translation initiation factor IF-3 [Planctomycetota bacterium]
MAKALRLNERIRISPIRVIDQDNNQLGVIPTHEALAKSREAGLDLVEVSPTESPPVCRIMDYGKHLYEKKKRQKVAAQSHVVLLKEIRMRPKTDAHDRMIKIKHAKEFIAEGHKVQFTMVFRGRERMHRDLANEAFGEIIAELAEIAKVERTPIMDGKRMVMIIVPGKK